MAKRKIIFRYLAAYGMTEAGSVRQFSGAWVSVQIEVRFPTPRFCRKGGKKHPFFAACEWTEPVFFARLYMERRI